MTWHRRLAWFAALLFAALALALVLVAAFGGNWLRAPLERAVERRTGRALVIGGDLDVQWHWAVPRLRAHAVTFANPAWATQRHMLEADVVEVSIDLWQLLRRNIVFPEVRLARARLFLEHGTGARRNWLLDAAQVDEGASLRVDRLILDDGVAGYDDVESRTSIRAQVASAAAGAARVTFKAQGQYRGQALTAEGRGGPVLSLRDQGLPYALEVRAQIGRTALRAQGSITGMAQLDAVDMRLALSGASLEELYALLGIAFPATHAYAVAGHLVHAGNTWRYGDFSGRIGKSDIAGSLTVATGGARPALTAALTSKLLELDDLAPVVGARPAAAATGAAGRRILPDTPFRTGRWTSVDAEVDLRAASIRRAAGLPMENLAAHLSLRDAVLRLDPLDFGFAGGRLAAAVTLDGRRAPIQAKARVRARGVRLAQLLPAMPSEKISVGQVNGEFDLAGSGDSVARMLATANGSAGLVVSGGEVSRLMMETAGLHLWEMLQLNLAGDERVKIRCAVAGFGVKAGVMTADALVFDTAVTTILGSGSIDLGSETLDLTLVQGTKNTSPLALTSPLHVRGSFTAPQVGVDKGRVAVRALGAVVLGMINPLLALIPLIDAGPGQDSDCGQLVRDARARLRSQGSKGSPSDMRMNAPQEAPGAERAPRRQ